MEKQLSIACFFFFLFFMKGYSQLSRLDSLKNKALSDSTDKYVFVDADSIDQADFEHAIVTHLHSSDAVLLVVSETTFADRIHRDDDWVRREIREALTLGLPLVLVCVEGLLPPSGLPEDIKDVTRKQGVNFYPEYFTPAVEKLTDFVTRAYART